MTDTRKPHFQTYQCINSLCRMRFPTDLSVQSLDTCPLCGSSMQPVGEPYTNFSSLPPSPRFNKVDLVLVLDNLRSTLNVGSIFRTADGGGVAHVYCCGTTPTPEHPKIKKSSLGAELSTAWSLHRNAVDLVLQLKQAGNIIVALESTKHSISLFDRKPVPGSKSLALIVGNEISGIDPEILAVADEILAIPMSGSKASLNVSVSAGIAIYTLLNQYPDQHPENNQVKFSGQEIL